MQVGVKDREAARWPEWPARLTAQASAVNVDAGIWASLLRMSSRVASYLTAGRLIAATLGLEIPTLAEDTCEALMDKSRAAVRELNSYASRPDATTRQALVLTRAARQLITGAMEACSGTKQEAGLKFSVGNIEAIEKALSSATTDQLHKVGVFPPPDEP